MRNEKENGSGRAYQTGGLFAQVEFFFLQKLGLVEMGEDGTRVRFFFWVWLVGAVGFQVSLDAAVTCGDDVATFLHQPVFGLDFFEQMCDFGGKIGH